MLSAKKDALTLEGIRQFYVAIEEGEWKLENLCNLYETLTITQAIIYCNTRRRVDFLADLPWNMENYLHRIGRSGGFGRTGAAINFVPNNDVWAMEDVERRYHTLIKEMPLDIADII